MMYTSEFNFSRSHHTTDVNVHDTGKIFHLSANGQLLEAIAIKNSATNNMVVLPNGNLLFATIGDR